jgi:DNA-binding MurR/RpiR family transcriptional regulator
LASVAQQTLLTSVADRVAERMAALTPAERRVAQHLVDSGPLLITHSAARIADAVGTSDATVVRTAQALGYGGLPELRRALVAEATSTPLDQRLRQTLEASPPGQLLGASVANHLGDLDVLVHSIAPDAFQGAVDVLATSARVVWRGVGPSAFVAGYGQLLCERMGHPSITLAHTGTSFADELLALQAGDTVVLLAYGRVQAHVSVLLDHAAATGCPVILVTDTPDRVLIDKVTTTLRCGRGAARLFSSHAATLLLVEALVIGLAAANPIRAEGSLARLNALRAALAGHRVDVDRR